jgi:two-component system nitrate/nitrite response regulator NarL
MDRFSVLILDPDQLCRTGLRLILAESAYDIAGEAGTVAEAREGLGRGAVDLLLLDLRDWHTEDATELVREAGARGIKVVVLTANRSRAALERAMSWGADAYLLKDVSPETLQRSLQLVMLGQQIFPAALMMPVAAAEPKAAGPVDGLSPREKQILLCLIDGRSNKEIGRVLGISEATVKVHLKALLRKLNVHNRTQVAVWAKSNGIACQGSPGVPMVA